MMCPVLSSQVQEKHWSKPSKGSPSWSGGQRVKRRPLRAACAHRQDGKVIAVLAT